MSGELAWNMERMAAMRDSLASEEIGRSIALM